jgi:hypothetical protein
VTVSTYQTEKNSIVGLLGTWIRCLYRRKRVVAGENSETVETSNGCEVFLWLWCRCGDCTSLASADSLEIQSLLRGCGSASSWTHLGGKPMDLSRYTAAIPCVVPLLFQSRAVAATFATKLCIYIALLLAEYTIFSVCTKLRRVSPAAPIRPRRFHATHVCGFRSWSYG